MSMEFIKKYKVIFILALVVIVGISSLFYRLYRQDNKTLEDFVVSYETFDKAVSDFSVNKTSEAEKKADDALTELIRKSFARVSSLIKNDGKIMDEMGFISAFAHEELESFKAYQKAVQSKSTDADKWFKDYNDSVAKRKAAYARFQVLGSQ